MYEIKAIEFDGKVIPLLPTYSSVIITPQKEVIINEKKIFRKI